MDYTKQLSDIEAGLGARTSVIAQATGEQTALQAAKDIITAGYQSDHEQIDRLVSNAVEEVMDENATLKTQVVDLNKQKEDLQAQLDTAQLVMKDPETPAPVEALTAPTQTDAAPTPN